jgi:hypothetical protein
MEAKQLWTLQEPDNSEIRLMTAEDSMYIGTASKIYGHHHGGFFSSLRQHSKNVWARFVSNLNLPVDAFAQLSSGALLQTHDTDSTSNPNAAQ